MKQEFKLTIKSPYGRQPLEQFRHFLNKVADDAETRWGIELSIEAIGADDIDVSDEFQ